MRKRLAGSVAPEVRDHMQWPALVSALRDSYDTMNAVNKAHLLMLVRQAIIDKQTGVLLAKELANMPTQEEMLSRLTPEQEDLFYNIEAYLISRMGLQVAGQLHTGRSRNDLAATTTRIRMRQTYFEGAGLILDIAERLVALARAEAGTVMTGYTHLQPGEPITAGHYFWAVAEALERDFTRIEESYKRLNMCPLGACAMAGTSFDLDRRFTADCLGFDGPIENTIDAVASRDYMLELLADYSLMMITLGRLAQDLYIWTSDEFRTVELSDSVASSSSIMPQKKNPVTLECFRSTSGHVIGALVDALFVHKGTSFGHSTDISTQSVKPFWPAYESMKSSLIILLATLTGIKINRTLSVDRARRNYTTMTELANNLVRKLGISFRQAHEVVGGLVAKCVNEGRQADAISAEMLVEQLAAEGVKASLENVREIVAVSLDPVSNVEAKKVQGGPAPSNVLAGADALEEAFRKHAEVLSSSQEAVANADRRLNEMVRRLASGDASGIMRSDLRRSPSDYRQLRL